MQRLSAVLAHVAFSFKYLVMRAESRRQRPFITTFLKLNQCSGEFHLYPDIVVPYRDIIYCSVPLSQASLGDVSYRDKGYLKLVLHKAIVFAMFNE